MRARYRKWVLPAAVLLSLIAPMAVAGPQQDAELAERELEKGDLIAATALWRKAAQQGYAPAQVRLAEILDKAEQDEEAVDWYRKAAEQGNAAGEYGLAVMYVNGEGVGKDPGKARFFLLRAANKNYVPAMLLLAESYKAGELGLPIDLEQAGIWEDKVYAVTGRIRVTPSVEKKK